jgi:methionine biosynthesis protein MetW
MRIDLTEIIDWIPANSRVLDLGCADGEFLAQLRDQKKSEGLGIEIDTDNLAQAIGRGLDVIQQDIDEGLVNFQKGSFDVVVMAHALQALQRPHQVLTRMVEIGQEAVVTFPNFGHWRCRLYLSLRGRMPVSKVMPYSWYDTPNIHFCTLTDFEALCDSLDIDIIDRDMVGTRSGAWLPRLWPNLFAVTAIYRIRRREQR